MHRLHELFPELRETLPALSLGSPPSPLRPLAGVRAGGEGVWVKDDGAYGDGGWGGNKVRKLEWLIPEAERLGRKTVVTVGGLGTNWGLACALYGREYGLQTVLALVDQPRDRHVEEQLERLRASGAELHFTGSVARTVLKMPWLLARHRRSWFLPAGGSSPVGALGAVETALELAAQVERGEMDAPSRIVTAVGSGGTAAGLVLGLQLAGLDTEVVAVVVNDKLTLNSRTLLRLARKSARLLEERGAELPEVDLDGGNLEVVEDQLGEGYGHRTEAATKATRVVSQDRLELDPVYTAKAMAGLLALGDEDLAKGPVVFLNTNGPRT